MKRLSPLVQMTMALVALCGTLVLLADLFFGVLPDRAAQTMQLRKNIGEALAVQVAALMQNEDRRALEQTLANVVARTDGVRSLAIRRADGEIVMQAGDHARVWRTIENDRSDLEQVTVPLAVGGQRWGSFELAFHGEPGNALQRWLSEPLVVTLLFVSAAGMLVFGLYMRRALQHLDPASVIPERVQGAFDAMAEGVVVVDARGRVLLANKAFRGLHPEAGSLRAGKPLSALPWLAAGLPADAAGHPWTRAMSERAGNAGYTLEAGRGGGQARRLVINCAPVTDPGGSVRGCLVTFNDVSELHRANEALREALAALSASKDEIEQKNDELQRLATRDPLTGCLNRRSFLEAFEAMFRDACAHGSALSCVMLDIDNFKAVNDTHGHAVGDRAIQEVAKKLHECARTTDLVCRYGGEEFCVVVPGIGLNGALGFAERVRTRIERECAAGVRETEGLRVTVSAGVEALSARTPSAPILLDRADKALYRAKRSGRNRVCEYAPGKPDAGVANRDALTGCLNARAFDAAFDAVLSAARTSGGLLGCAMLSIDNLKAVHEAHGAAIGDRVVQQVARKLLASAVATDLVGRYGAETFCIVAPELGPAEIVAFVEGVRADVERDCGLALPVAPGLRVTISAGVDSLAGNALGALTLVDRADQAHLRARRSGGNRVCEFTPAAKAARVAAAADAEHTDKEAQPR